MKNNEKIKNKIIEELIDLELPLTGLGFEYWVELLLAEYNNKFKSPNITNRYAYLAKKHDSNSGAVERILRTGKENMEKRIKEKYKIKTKITNETILIIFRLNFFQKGV